MLLGYGIYEEFSIGDYVHFNTGSYTQTACAVIRSNGQEIEINNGADLETLQAILSFVGRL